METPDSSSRAAPGSNPSSSTSSLTSPQPQTAHVPERSPSQSSLHKGTGTGSHIGSHSHSHRHSFAENQRHPPPSPRSQRHPSFTQQAIQELMNHPPTNRHPNPRYAGRDWRDIALGELAVPEDVRWADLDTSVEDATMALIKNNPTNVVLVRESSTAQTAFSTFDHSDLNAYLLVVVGLAKPDDEDIDLYRRISTKAQSQEPIPLREIQPLCRKEDLVSLPADCTLDKAIEIFGGGVHRLLIKNPQTSEVVGVLNQLRVLEFFWHEAVNFPVIDKLYGNVLRDLQIGTQQIIAIGADAPLADALLLMSNEGLTSVAVVDAGRNVVGNISTADVRHLTNAASLPLLKSSCMHFISVILSERGMERGRDSFPVFYVNPYSTLAHTVAKLVATHSHRMWIVESASPSPSAPATPLLQPTTPLQQQTSGNSGRSPSLEPVQPATILVPSPSGVGSGTTVLSTPQSPMLPTQGQGFSAVPSVSAAAMPGANLSGRLTGVVSLTDILNLFARSSGLSPSDPSEQRARRRRSSSSSVRPSLDLGNNGSRGSMDFRR